ncbi:hypothetical protein NKI88_18230 [Mesorhizobium sp. M0317]|uniref:hypothetical protein n=1 Tax=Mesorhizobium sp. M0317 TaxID=2956935 RepID=UPI0033385B9A
MAKFKVGNVVLCEHAVLGANNKHTLVNVYAGDIIVASLPATLSFGLYIEFLSGNNPEKINIEVSLARDPALIAETIIPNSGTGIILIPVFPLKIEKDLNLEVFAIAEGFKRQLILKKRIYQGAIPT